MLARGPRSRLAAAREGVDTRVSQRTGRERNVVLGCAQVCHDGSTPTPTAKLRTPRLAWEGAHPSQTGVSPELVRGEASLPGRLSQPCAPTNQQENHDGVLWGLFCFTNKNTTFLMSKPHFCPVLILHGRWRRLSCVRYELPLAPPELSSRGRPRGHEPSLPGPRAVPARVQGAHPGPRSGAPVGGGRPYMG